MPEFHWPWAFILLPLPFIVRLLLPALKRPAAALRVPSPQLLPGQSSDAADDNQQDLPGLILLVLLWLSLITALARPYQSGDVVEMPVSGRDLILAVDLSDSMKIGDMQLQGQQVNRLDAVKHVLNDFIPKRQGDRLGLVLFGDEAYLQVPLTFDTHTVRTLMNEAQIGLAGKRTAIGDALGLTIKRLKNNPEDSRVVILLTDGQNTAGEVDPLKAAELAATYKVKVYTIGLGADQMEVSNFFGSRTINPSKELDENALRTIAQSTGGAFFRARNPDELQQIYALIDELEPTEKDPEIYRPQKNLFQWPLAAALLFTLLLGLWQNFPGLPSAISRRAAPTDKRPENL
ncbi:MAG: BatB protein [Oceanospirillaceae bacterium]|nr:BatB protein [Oceanospirillaceae bacterium]MBT12304.1 BatB protein [Oceanospirillaceae bacterium]|tara:strand:- start:54976 stop:56016 length:1041 start_codon:yes stop_codon:yes gene_type:complete